MAATEDEFEAAFQKQAQNGKLCKEAISLLYQTYIVDSRIAAMRAAALQILNAMCLEFGAGDAIGSIEPRASASHD